MSNRARRRRRCSRLVVAGALGVLSAVAVAQPASAQCEIETESDSFDVRDADDPFDPIVLDEGDSVTVTRPADGWLMAVLWLGPVPTPFPVPGAAGETSTVDLDDVEWLTVGLYRVAIFGPGAGECDGTFWVQIKGRSPFVTVAGIGATVVALAGAGLVAQAARRARRERCSIRRGVVGGVLFGLGASFLAQQLAVLPMLLPVAALALLIPALGGGLVARAFCAHSVTRTLTPLLAAPLVVEAGERFEVRVGVAVSTPGERRRRGPDDEVTVQLVAGAAEVVDGLGWRHTVAVGRGQAEAALAVTMRASRGVGPTNLTAFYSSGGQTVGMARRPLWVVEPGSLPPPDVSGAANVVAAPIRVPVAHPPVDLELRATFAGPRALNVLQWTAESPHRSRLAIPDVPVTVDLGSEPESFAATLLVDVTEGEGRPGLAELLLGTGRQLARTIDPVMLDVVRATLAETAPRPPRVLLLTEESSIPWELAAVEPAPAGTPPFLATRTVVGRWFLAPGAPLPPPVITDTAVRSVVATEDLPAAGSEARRLQAEFRFGVTPPTLAAVLNGFEESGLVHLACHGSWHFEEDRCFLQLADGRLLPRHIAGLRLDQHPFVFLNACQVGAGGEALDTPTGFPAELVFAGAAGCVTPLWSVRDDQAYEIAIEFYRDVLAGRAPAELIHELRTRSAIANLASSTPFAYQFCGHPDLRLVTAAVVARSA